MTVSAADGERARPSRHSSLARVFTAAWCRLKRWPPPVYNPSPAARLHLRWLMQLQL